MKELGIKNIITGIFVLAAIAAFMVFSGVVKIGENKSQEARGTVAVWGTIPYQTIQQYIEKAKEQNLSVIYTQKKPATYESELINAFASGSGPDVFIMPHENILRHSDKVLEIPYSSFPRSSYEATYINESDLFLTDTGIIAFPMIVDPLVMYYNKPLISSAFILDIPKYWDELIEFTPEITEYSGTGEVIISAAALGTYENIPNSKAIISALILQNKNNIVGTDPTTQKKRSLLSFDENELEKTTQALDFYTSFSRFGSDTYSWNEALVDSKSKFIAGEVALYFGRGSEAGDISRKNPNLDFGVELFPQVRSSNTKLTQGAMVGIGISKQTKNIPAALAIAAKLAGPDIAGGLADALFVAPARKDLLRDRPDDALKTLIYNSAIISGGWIDPDPDLTNEVMRNMIRNINTGALSTQDSISRASADLNNVLDKTINTRININQ